MTSDLSETEVTCLLKELLASVGTTHANTVLRDALWAIEDRALSRADQNSKDAFLEQRVRETLQELSKTGGTCAGWELAVELIESLLLIDYTDRSNKFTRLCRSILSLMQCGTEKVAKDAKRVLMKMLQLDMVLGKEAPLQAFLPKELKDACDSAMKQLQGGVQHSRLQQSHALATMLACEAVIRVHPKYAAACRTSIVQLSIQLCGSADHSVRNSAFGSLVATLSSPAMDKAAGKQADSAAEIRKITDDITKVLRGSQGQEAQVISALLSFSAVLESRGPSAIDKQVLGALCLASIEQHKITKSPAVKNVICGIVPLLAKHDPSYSTRRSPYTTILMEPLKNVRDESDKPAELRNMASYIRNVGIEVLDSAARVNLESILQRYISRRNTQTECWNVFASMFKGDPGKPQGSSVPPPVTVPESVMALIGKFTVHLANAIVSANLLQYITHIQSNVTGILAAQIARARHEMVDTALRRAANDGGNTPITSGPGPGAGGGGLKSLFGYFKNSSVEDLAPVTPSQISPEEIEVALDALSKRVINDLNMLEELRVNILPLQRHHDAFVRRQCSKTIIECLSNCTEFVKKAKISKDEYSDRLVKLLDAYANSALLELEPQCRLAMVEFLSSTKSIRQYVADPRVVQSLLSFVQDSSRIREVVLRLLVSIAREWRQQSETNEIMINLKLTVETCVVALEFTTDDEYYFATWRT